MEGRLVSQTHTQLAQIMTPLEANVIGNVFGGAVLSMIDLTASATAQRYCGKIVVTASFDRVDFHEPIEVGYLVTMEGSVTYVGRTSMEITIQVYATDLKAGESRHTNTARVTMVALEDGKPSAVPKLICETREDRLRFLEGKLRREMRNQLTQHFDRVFEKIRAMDDATLNDLLEKPNLLEMLT